MKSIYKYLDGYSISEINDAINNLSLEEQKIIILRYGKDLNNPQIQEQWNKEFSKKFYGSIIPKLKRILAQNQKNDNLVALEEDKIWQFNYPDYDYLITLLNSGKTADDICKTLNINYYQLYNQLLCLKNMGMDYSRKYYFNGSIVYNSLSNIGDIKKWKSNFFNQTETLITDACENEIKLIAISDLHLGNELERIDLIDRVFNYCNKNDIHIIFLGGDIIDGTFTKGHQKISDVHKQLEHFLKIYPHDKSILTFGVAGDHDLSALKKGNINLMTACSNYRHDIIIGGYNNALLYLKNDQIHLYHYINSGNLATTSASIVFHGHTHNYMTFMNNNRLNVAIPTLSDLTNAKPSALEVTLHFNKIGYIESVLIKHLQLTKSDIIVSEVAYELPNNKENLGCIKNVEKKDAELMQLTREKPCLSQVEKFYKKYGNKAEN